MLVNASFTTDGRHQFPWTRRNSGVVSITTDGTDTGRPLFYGQATDPVYQVASCLHDSVGIHRAVGVKLRAPSGMTYSGTTGDRHLDIWDQTTDLLFSSYASGDSTSVPPLPKCPGAGHSGTLSDPCPFHVRHGYCSVSNWTSDKGYGFNGEDSLGSGGYALHPTVRTPAARNSYAKP